ncbi:hypothetical protein B0T14DRAFT_497636 [Immersiella caudata]|uniref:Uncharacterized protein n=1 Tax=Immersiella caudata TaxID=314043 RepID=A0AA40BWL2_9PEZI|nr:hypothetical protein B0T14DRAFT_497636 [Immersiella caudata]
MHLPTLFLTALGATTARAIHLTLIARQDGQGLGSLDLDYQGTWHEGDQVHTLPFASGCGRDRLPPNVVDLCIDNDSARAHAFRGNGAKLCFRKWADVPVGSCYRGLCYIERWHEHPC